MLRPFQAEACFFPIGRLMSPRYPKHSQSAPKTSDHDVSRRSRRPLPSGASPQEHREARSDGRRQDAAATPFCVCGVHPVEETLERLPKVVLGESRLWIAQSRSMTDIQPLLDRASEVHVPVATCPVSVLDGKAGETRHQGVLLEIRSFPYADLEDVLVQASDKPLLVVLDQIQDPHNLGAIIRSAAAFGATAVVIPKDRAAQVTPVALKTSAGQAWRVPVCRVTNIAQTLRSLKAQDFVIVGADIEGSPLHTLDFNAPCALVMGNEGDGMRRLTRTLCDHFARIDMASGVESLNVSVAAGIFLYQASLARQFH